MEWIAVEEKLPKDIKDMCEYDWVLVRGDSSDIEVVSIAQFRDNEWKIMGDNLGAHSCTGLYSFYSKDVRYWMEIPY